MLRIPGLRILLFSGETIVSREDESNVELWPIYVELLTLYELVICGTKKNLILINDD